jgi:hypothetical protein
MSPVGIRFFGAAVWKGFFLRPFECGLPPRENAYFLPTNRTRKVVARP